MGGPGWNQQATMKPQRAECGQSEIPVALSNAGNRNPNTGRRGRKGFAEDAKERAKRLFGFFCVRLLDLYPVNRSYRVHTEKGHQRLLDKRKQLSKQELQSASAG